MILCYFGISVCFDNIVTRKKNMYLTTLFICISKINHLHLLYWGRNRRLSFLLLCIFQFKGERVIQKTSLLLIFIQKSQKKPRTKTVFILKHMQFTIYITTSQFCFGWMDGQNIFQQKYAAKQMKYQNTMSGSKRNFSVYKDL